MIDWHNVINKLDLDNGVCVSFDNIDNIPVGASGYEEILENFKKANYNFDIIKWYDYFPGVHFDKAVEDDFSKIVNCKPCRSWISRVDPGYYAPYHWDIEEKEEFYLSLGSLIRYTCFITEPKFGQVMIVEDQCLYNQPKNAIYQWPSYKAWHAASNAGLEPQYLYQFLGYK
jgi:hypothetical protein